MPVDLFRLHAAELRNTWQSRCLAFTRYEPIGMVVLSVLAHSFDDAMPILLRVTFRDFVSISTPFICSHAKINKAGQIVADVLWSECEEPSRGELIYHSTKQLEGVFRKLADQLKLKDAERKELFAAVKRWVTADMRLDPTMDPADPDARRLVAH